MANVSFVIGINQTNQSTNLPRQCTIRKKAQNLERAAVCQSSQCPALVRFPVLGQIESQAPLLVVPLPSIPLNFFLAKRLSLESKHFGFPQRAYLVGGRTTAVRPPQQSVNADTSAVDNVSGKNYMSI